MFSYDAVVALGSLLAGLGAVISAVLAWRSFRAAEKLQHEFTQKEKERAWKEIQIQRSRAEAKKDAIVRVAEDLKLAYKSLFTHAGQGAGSSRRDMYLERVESAEVNALQFLEDINSEAKKFDNLAKVNYDAVRESLVMIEDKLIRMSSIYDLLRDELKEIRQQNAEFRARAIAPPPIPPYGSGSPPRR